MRIMLIGVNGQVGWELARSLMPLGEVIPLTRQQCDLSLPETIPAIVQEIKPDVIVNAAAYTAVDKAEEEEALATIINGIAVGVLAEEAKKQNALLIYYSTDYVFDGTKTSPYTEEDIPNPINAYGRSKLAGEKAIQQVNGKYLIFRTSWVYAPRGANFAKTMLRLASERDELRVVADQFGAPTSAELIADVTALILCQFKIKHKLTSGIYHLTASGKTSWFGYAQLVLENAARSGQNLRISSEQIEPITTAEFQLPAKRPANSCMKTDKLKSTFDIVFPQWQKHIERSIVETLV